MGYRSTVVIAVHKSVFGMALLEPDLIPKELQPGEESWVDRTHTSETAHYWVIEGIKWYGGVSEITSFFDELASREEEAAEPIVLYGALRLGEDDDDVETWGDPGEFDVHTRRVISMPF